MIDCPHKCGFKGYEPAFLAHLKVFHEKITKPEPGSQAELIWLQYGITEEKLLEDEKRPKVCPICEDRFRREGNSFFEAQQRARHENHNALVKHLRGEHAAEIGLVSHGKYRR